MTTDRDAALLKIATNILDLETLEARHRDCLDFKEHGVLSIKEALEAAYAAGAASVAKPKRTRRTNARQPGNLPNTLPPPAKVLLLEHTTDTKRTQLPQSNQSKRPATPTTKATRSA